MRTTSTYSRVRWSWRAKRTPCQPSDTCGPDGPSPRRKRPPESWSIVAAVIAVMAGLRAGIWKIPEHRWMRSVPAASQASTVAVSEP